MTICSSCGRADHLSLVTMMYAGPRPDSEPDDSDDPRLGRLLVYCESCRIEHLHNVGVSIPLQLVDEDLLMALYREGITASEPETVVDLILDWDAPGLAERLRDASVDVMPLSGIPQGCSSKFPTLGLVGR